MDERIVIFGASGGGIKVAQTLKSFDVDFYCFLDNDRKKWGTKALGTEKKIYSPDILWENNYRIIIASEHQAEIEAQLEQMGQLKNLLLKEELILPCVEGLFQDFWKELGGGSDFWDGKNRKVILDLAEGVQLGGIETWTYTVTRELKKTGVDVEVFAKRTDMRAPEDISSCFTYFDIEYFDFKENVYRLAKEIVKRSPCTVIINKHTQILYAAYLAKKLCSEGDIQIVSVIHNDLITLYRRQKSLDDIMDKIICVSKRIKETLIKQYGIKEEKIFYKESPVYVESSLNREYTLDVNHPIRIGYAGRLEKTQKRMDRLLKCIEKLEEVGCNYLFLIAGAGGYQSIIEEFILNNGLLDRVFLKGQIPKEKMADFWKSLDIYISVSDFEGSSISLLEAMANGVVPVVTEVSGADEFVRTGENGYIVNFSDIEKIAWYIKNLGKNRNLLKKMGECSRKIIIEKCNPKEYGEYIAKVCGNATEVKRQKYNQCFLRRRTE